MGAGESPQEKPDLAQTFDLVFKGGTVVNHAGEGLADIGVREGRIAEIGSIGAGAAGETIDATGLHILPGVIDSQVHFREPGLEHKEDLETGSRSAVLGGVTAVFEMPNTKPPTTSAEALAAKVARARGTACIATSPSLSAPRATMSTILPHSSFSREPPASKSSWAPRPAIFWSMTRRRWPAFSPPSGAAPPSIQRMRRG